MPPHQRLTKVPPQIEPRISQLHSKVLLSKRAVHAPHMWCEDEGRASVSSEGYGQRWAVPQSRGQVDRTAHHRRPRAHCARSEGPLGALEGQQSKGAARAVTQAGTPAHQNVRRLDGYGGAGRQANEPPLRPEACEAGAKRSREPIYDRPDEEQSAATRAAKLVHAA